jgi:hypothetical protein
MELFCSEQNWTWGLYSIPPQRESELELCAMELELSKIELELSAADEEERREDEEDIFS